MRLALDIGGTFIKCASVTDDGGIINSEKFPTDFSLDTGQFASHVIESAREFKEKTGEKFDVAGAGMAGFTDGRRGIIYESPNIPNVKNLHLAEILSEGLGIPSYIDNDATTAAWGEYLFGDYGDVKDLLVVTLGTGIGGGLVIDGRLCRGAKGMAGEIGQMVLDPDAPDCAGGGKGTLEHFAGKAGLQVDYADRAGIDALVEPEEIHSRALDGDSAARDSFSEYGRRLGIVLASASNLLDPGAVVLTGGILGAWELFSGSLNESFVTYLITPHKDRLKVTKTRLDGNAGILGAAFLDRAYNI